MTGSNNLCGLCKSKIGFGPGFRTGIAINNTRVVLMPTDPHYAGLKHLPVKATVMFCLPCLDNIVNNLIRKDAQGRSELDERDVQRAPLQLVVNPKDTKDQS